ncbi:unnamed protein product, partial [Dibothriocephalus latus]
MSDDYHRGSRHLRLLSRNSAFASSSTDLYGHGGRYRGDRSRCASDSIFPPREPHKRNFRDEGYLPDPYVSNDFSPFGVEDRNFDFDPKHRCSPIGASFHLEASSPSAEKPSLAL